MVITDRIVERTAVSVPCPPMKVPKSMGVATQGFPQPPVNAKNIHSSLHTQDELHTSLKELAKLEWTNPVQVTEDVGGSGGPRYDFEGNVVSEDCDNSDTYRSELYHHGKQPGLPGYTIEELFHLSQSGFAAQKIIALRALGNIVKTSSVQEKGVRYRSDRRQLHSILVGQYKAHVRFSVACSDVSVGVRAEAWEALCSLIQELDSQCACVVADLVSIPEFLQKGPEEGNVASVKVFLYIVNEMERSGAASNVPEGFTEQLTDVMSALAEQHGLSISDYICGVQDLNAFIKSSGSTEDCAEIIAAICDRVGNLAEPLSEEEIDLFEKSLGACRPSIPFFVNKGVDQFQWTTRANFAAQALMAGASEKVLLFLCKLCYLFTSDLFPPECRAGIWTNIEVLQNIARLVDLDTKSLQLLGNHALIDFACKDLAQEPSRDSALVTRAIRNGCKRFLDEEAAQLDQESNELVTTATKIVLALDNV